VHNYRSPAAVVAAATAVVEQAPGRARRPLIPRTSQSPAILRHHVATAADEAELVAAEIERAVGGTSLTSFDTDRADGSEEALAFHDIAVLYRTAAQAEAIAEALDRATIPHRRVGIDPLLARPAVARLCAALKGRAAEGAGGTVEALVRAAAEPDPEGGRAADLLAALAVPFGSDVAAFLASLAVLHETDLRLEPQRVHLLTLHAAKGLEFPLVFVTGCEDGLLPLRFPGREVDLEEERRLLYVGMTRARRRLVLTAARQRTLFGRTVESAPCPFLAHLPPELLEDVVAARRRPKARQLSLL
jgi:superfamily I DNA/RNA helicase